MHDPHTHKHTYTHTQDVLKANIIEELKLNKNKLLVHKGRYEASKGKSASGISADWSVCTPADIKTSKEVCKV
jgi:hypothetical protein